MSPFRNSFDLVSGYKKQQVHSEISPFKYPSSYLIGKSLNYMAILPQELQLHEQIADQEKYYWFSYI